MLGVLVWIVVILLICFSVFGGSWLLPLYVLFVVVLGLAGIISNIIAMPILKALATITEAAFIYKLKHKQN